MLLIHKAKAFGFILLISVFHTIAPEMFPVRRNGFGTFVLFCCGLRQSKVLASSFFDLPSCVDGLRAVMGIDIPGLFRASMNMQAHHTIASEMFPVRRNGFGTFVTFCCDLRQSKVLASSFFDLPS